MEHHVELDVSQEQTAICVIDGAGQIVWQGRCTSTSQAIAATMRAKAPQAKRIGLEAGPLSELALAQLARARLAGNLPGRASRQGGTVRPGQ